MTKNFWLKWMPPQYAIFYFLFALALHFNIPLRPLLEWRLGGVLLAASGFMFLISAWVLFWNAKTAIRPVDEPTAFVDSGPYRFTRNPMYVGVTLVLSGIALIFGTPFMFLPPAAFFLTAHLIFIPLEEANLERVFGEAYLDYTQRVRRWL